MKLCDLALWPRSAALALAPVSALAQTGPAGDWEMTMNTPQGANTVGLSLTLTAATRWAAKCPARWAAVPVTGTAQATARV